VLHNLQFKTETELQVRLPLINAWTVLTCLQTMNQAEFKKYCNALDDKWSSRPRSPSSNRVTLDLETLTLFVAKNTADIVYYERFEQGPLVDDVD